MKLRMTSVSALVLAGIMVVALAARADDPIWTQTGAYSLSVGQRAVIYAIRSNTCDGAAPSFESIKAKLPSAAFGTLRDGGVVQRQSESCKTKSSRDWIEARAITYTAAKPGSETLRFYGDPVVITVR
jgi:hypothetical protein